MRSEAKTVKEYLAGLPAERRAAIEAVRAVVLANLDDKYEEGIQYGMISYHVPHSVYPAGYHCDPRQPVPFAALASQKNYMSLYLMSVYGSKSELEWLEKAWKKAGKKLDMGKCCIRFKRIEDLPLEVVGEAIRRVPAKVMLEWYGKAMGEVAERKAGKKGAPEKAAAKR